MKEKHPIVKAIAKFIFFLGRTMLSLRYKVSLNNTQCINSSNPVLFLPNHQAVVDPMLLVSHLYPKKNVVPVITSTYYDLPFLNHFFKNWGAVRVSDLERGSRNVNVLKDITEATIKALHEKHSIVIYPAGQIAGQGFEKILNKKGAFEIVHNLPENVQIVGVRISGLWGSKWSKAWTGNSPDFTKNVFTGIYYTLANLIFFIPRRRVNIHFEDITFDCKKSADNDKQTFNYFLEDFYNKNGEEEPTFLKHYFYGPGLHRQLPSIIKGSVKHVSEVKQNKKTQEFPAVITTGVTKIVAQHLQININEIKPEHSLIHDLGIDSITLVEIIKDIETQFKVEDYNEISELKLVVDLFMLANGELQQQQNMPACSFSKINPYNDFIKINHTNTIPELFIRKFTSNKNLPFSYDTMLGENNRKDFFLKTCVISEIIKNKCKDKHVGIMLPALQSTSMLIMATYLAGKIPVMLNWTVGKKILIHCVKEASVSTIFSASSFVEKIKDQLPGLLLRQIIYLDKEVPKAGLKVKLTGLIKSKYPKSLISFKKTDDIAVILFTSGSENMPKAVPLTHDNIIHDLKGTLELIDFERNRVLMAFLPPFHSFGFTVLSILPAITGTRVAYSPDPTDGRAIVRVINHTSASILVAAPSFLNIILNNALRKDLTTLKYVVSGAEAMPDSIRNHFEQLAPKASIIEGYGITECSPVLSLNPLQQQKKGSVGKIIKRVRCIILDLDTNKPLGPKQVGMIYFHGKNVFNGYLNTEIESPFIKINNLKYYKTGDLGYLDEDGFLFLTGRLKRFIKIAGEMISLPFIENILSNNYGEVDEKVLAVEGSDKVSPPQIVLFCSKPIALTEANETLRKNNAPPIAKISRIELMDEIPLLGTGKVDYKKLREKII